MFIDKNNDRLIPSDVVVLFPSTQTDTAIIFLKNLLEELNIEADKNQRIITFNTTYYVCVKMFSNSMKILDMNK